MGKEVKTIAVGGKLVPEVNFNFSYYSLVLNSLTPFKMATAHYTAYSWEKQSSRSKT